jgi:hypothetical protein
LGDKSVVLWSSMVFLMDFFMMMLSEKYWGYNGDLFGIFTQIYNQLDMILAGVTPAKVWYGSEFKANVTNNSWFDQVCGNLGEGL